jgi:hypothetical protein
MEGPTSSGGSRNRNTRLTLHEHDDDDIKIYIKTAPTCFGVITIIRE